MRADMYGPPDNLEYGRSFTAGTRYNVCMLIDDICLLSLDENRTGPLVMLVKKQWGTDVATEDYQVHPDYEDGWMIDHDEGPGG